MSGVIIKNSRNTENAPKSAVSTQSVAFSHYNNISAQLPVDAKSGKIVDGGIKEQAAQCLTNIKAIVESIDHTMTDVVRINVFLKNIMDVDAVNEVYATFFPSYLPTNTTLAVAALPLEGALVQMDAVISNGEGTQPQEPCDLVKLVRNTANAPQSSVSTQTVAFSHYNHISAQLPIDPKTGNIVVGGVKEQAAQCLKNIKGIMEGIDVPFDDIVKVNIHVQNLSDVEAVNEAYTTFFPDSSIARTVGYVPARSVVVAEDLPMHALVQMDAVISNGEGTTPQEPCDLVKLVRNTENAPKSSVSTQSVAFSHYNHISAQLPIDPKTGNIVVGGAKEQAAQCLKNIKGIMEGIDVPFDDIVKVNIHVRNLSDIEAINEAYTTFFPDSSIARALRYVPARSVVVAEGLPMHALVQIDATVSHGDGTPPQAVEDRHGIVIKANNTDNAPKTSLSTQTVAFSHYNNISAQLPVDAKTGELVAGGAKEQAAQCLNNIKAIVESIGHNMDDTVKINIQVRNMADMDAVNEVYTTFFKGDLPARTVIGVSDMPMAALVQMDAILSNAEGTPPAL